MRYKTAAEAVNSIHGLSIMKLSLITRLLIPTVYNNFILHLTLTFLLVAAHIIYSQVDLQKKKSYN